MNIPANNSVVHIWTLLFVSVDVQKHREESEGTLTVDNIMHTLQGKYWYRFRGIRIK